MSTIYVCETSRILHTSKCLKGNKTINVNLYTAQFHCIKDKDTPSYSDDVRLHTAEVVKTAVAGTSGENSLKYSIIETVPKAGWKNFLTPNSKVLATNKPLGTADQVLEDDGKFIEDSFVEWNAVLIFMWKNITFFNSQIF